MRRLTLLLAALSLAGCAGAPVCGGAAPGRDVVYVVDHGWHTDVGIPARELSGGATVFRTLFPAARAFVFGFGKRSFFTAKVETWREYLLGPFPGPGAILVTDLSVMPDAAYGPAATITLHLPQGGARALSVFLWRALAKDQAGGPRLIATGPYRGSRFYAAAATYTLGYTCNTWSADALRAAGTSVRPGGVIFAGQVMRRARRAEVCPLPADGRLAAAH